MVRHIAVYFVQKRLKMSAI